MTQAAALNWYSVRCVFIGRPPDRPHYIYEERITVWQAPSPEAAIAKAEEEAEQYVEVFENDTYVGMAQCYWMYDELRDGAEVFSLMRDSTLEPDEYVKTFFRTGAEHEGDVSESPEP
ncbi:DUF4288 domain-containing protein [Demequina sp. TTPB684]|uniref:DUF4288 domain-containing protein n=1 Tax=unclassified Demequina TaxID=2620311 RepID=UPI001CF1A7A1|nr:MULTISPECIES: DUF4288 domain-containing protein [unclassified Demequina]MCB2411688.1 DUF4288 domain-containing protein [Demequina sp. TTPB684]UPU88915.1 DUF4288 domain-containing protein [Demequina sp. TMPB413]